MLAKDYIENKKLEDNEEEKMEIEEDNEDVWEEDI
jgi:hypothetical protein